MKALVLDKPGSFKMLHITEMDTPKPGPGEVLVKVQAAGLNPVDYKLAKKGHPSWKFPFVLGLDVAGVVQAVGDGVEEWQEGDPVYYHGDLTKPGGFAQYAIANSEVLSWLPENVNYVQAASLPCAAFTAYQALFRKLNVQQGRSILITGGAGGVGSYAIQMAKAAGMRVMTTCSLHNSPYVSDLGANHMIDYRNERLPERIEKLTEGHGVDYVLDTVGPETATECLNLLAYNGGIACIAGMPDLTQFVPHKTAPSIHEVFLGGAFESGNPNAIKDLTKIAREVANMVGRGQIRPIVEEIISLSDIPDALGRLALRHVRGKIVAQIAERN